MRIINIMTSKVLGGVEQAFLDYNEALSLNGHEVYAVIDKRSLLITNEKKLKIKNYILILFLFFKPYFLLFPYWFLKIKKIKPDIIIIHSKKVLPLFSKIGKILKIPTVIVCHNEKTKGIKKADWVFSITEYQKNIFKNNGLNNVFVIPNMITFKKDYKEFVDFSNPPTFGLIGRFSPEKGFLLFINACKILKDKNIDFKVKIGGAPQKQYIDEYNKMLSLIEKHNLKDNIEFLGWIFDKDKFYNDIDIFVLPSLEESFGIVLLEAMMYSKPIISSLANGPKEILENQEAALLFEINDIDELSNQMIKLINNKELAKKISKNGYDLVNNEYTIGKIANKLNNAIMEVVHDYSAKDKR